MQLNLRWQAILEDGGQIDEGAVTYQELVTKGYRIKEFRLLDHARTGVQAQQPIMTVHLTPEHKLFYRARTAIEVSLSLGPGKIARGRTIIVGWQKPETTKKEPAGTCAVHSQCIILIHEQTGQVEVLDRFRLGEGIMLAPWEMDAGFVAEALA